MCLERSIWTSPSGDTKIGGWRTWNMSGGHSYGRSGYTQIKTLGMYRFLMQAQYREVLPWLATSTTNPEECRGIYWYSTKQHRPKRHQELCYELNSLEYHNSVLEPLLCTVLFCGAEVALVPLCFSRILKNKTILYFYPSTLPCSFNKHSKGGWCWIDCWTKTDGCLGAHGLIT